MDVKKFIKRWWIVATCIFQMLAIFLLKNVEGFNFLRNFFYIPKRIEPVKIGSG